MRKPIIVLGEVMLDKYTFGKVERINPEAPVPVLNTTKEKYTLGGAGNVANNLSSLKEDVYLISLIGNDFNAELIKELCEKKDIEYFLWHEFADHYIEMIKSSIYENKNVESIKYTMYLLSWRYYKVLLTSHS